MHRCLLVAVLVACSSKPEPMPPKKPNNELIVGEFERHPPAGTQAVRFDPDGNWRLAKTRADLDHTPHLADGTYKIDGNKLTLSASSGQCADGGEGTYEIVVSKIGIRTVKVSDGCADRARWDGMTWWRTR